MSKGLSFMGTGIVIEDLKPNEKVIKATLIDMVESEGVLGNESTSSTIIRDNSNTRKVIIGNEVDFIEALWEGDDNKINAPTIVKGEQVNIIRYNNQDQYYWNKSRGYETDLRGREVIIDGVSTIDRSIETNIGKSVGKDDMYYIIKDSIYGKLQLVTNMKNQELAAYTLSLHGKDGKFSVVDDRGNFIDIDTTKDEATISTNKAINLIAPKVNIKCDEFNIDTKVTNFNSKTTILKGNELKGDVGKSSFTGTMLIKGALTLKSALKSSAGGAFKSIVKFAATGKAW